MTDNPSSLGNYVTADIGFAAEPVVGSALGAGGEVSPVDVAHAEIGHAVELGDTR